MADLDLDLLVAEGSGIVFEQLQWFSRAGRGVGSDLGSHGGR